MSVDLLDLSRLEAGSLELRPEQVDLGELTRSVSGEFEPSLAQHDALVPLLYLRPGLTVDVASARSGDPVGVIGDDAGFTAVLAPADEPVVPSMRPTGVGIGTLADLCDPDGVGVDSVQLIVRVLPAPSSVIGRIPQALSDLDAVVVDNVAFVIGGWNGTECNRAIYAVKPTGSGAGAGLQVHAVAQLPLGVRYPAVAPLAGRGVGGGGRPPSSATSPGSRPMSMGCWRGVGRRWW